MANERNKGALEQGNKTSAESEWLDKTKFMKVYAEMHELAAKDPNKKFTYIFKDNKDKMLDFLHGKFEEHPDLIPHNVTLRVKKSDGSQLDKIQGLGLIDENYAKSVEKIAKIFQEITAKNSVSNTTSQPTINTGPMDAPLDEFGKFKEWRRKQNQNRGKQLAEAKDLIDIKIESLKSSITRLKTDFDETVTASTALSYESKRDMREKFKILIKNLSSEIDSLKEELETESKKYRSDYSKIEKKTEDLLKTVDAIKGFLKNGVKPLAEGIIVDKANSENNKKAALNLAEKIKAAENNCKSEVMKLSVSQKIKTGVYAFVGAVGMAILGLVGGLLLGGPIGPVVGAIEGGKFGLKAGEKLSFRGHPVKPAAKDFIASTETAMKSLKPIEAPSDNSIKPKSK